MANSLFGVERKVYVNAEAEDANEKELRKIARCLVSVVVVYF